MPKFKDSLSFKDDEASMPKCINLFCFSFFFGWYYHTKYHKDLLSYSLELGWLVNKKRKDSWLKKKSDGKNKLHPFL